MNQKPASKNQIKNRKKLLSAKYRKKEGMFLAEGIRCVEQIVESGVIEVIELLAEEGFITENRGWDNVPVFSLTRDDFFDLADTETPQGVIAVCKIPEETGADLLAKKEGVLVAFDEIQDPGNLGTMIRTASWFGAAGMLFGKGSVDPFHPKVVRSTAGATGLLPFLKGDLHQLFNKMENSGRKIYLLDGSHSAEDLRVISPQKKAVLTVGNEGNGIHKNLFTPNRTALRIDGESERIDSLNAAVALSIGLYQFNAG